MAQMITLEKIDFCITSYIFQPGQPVEFTLSSLRCRFDYGEAPGIIEL
jgi:hypothetical protein